MPSPLSGRSGLNRFLDTILPELEQTVQIMSLLDQAISPLRGDHIETPKSDLDASPSAQRAGRPLHLRIVGINLIRGGADSADKIDEFL